ncbi:MAG: MFS transporter [Rhodobacteraceae bacterium]|jgi:DHA1 family tetracycline resistance protein-like MFS transporter|nr:MFS transporter [Paracoccaceae bacterium]
MTQRLPIAFILLTLLIDAMGIGLILPVMPDLIQEVTGGTLAQAALWGGVLTTVFAVMQFLFGPTVGALSDRFGRRPVLLVSLGVMALDYLVMALAGTIWLLLVTRVVGGITAATQSTATAYIADISRPEEKAARFGLTGAAFGLGFVLGPMAGGLLSEFGTRAPFFAAAALALANMAFGWVVLRETVTDRIRRRFDPLRANPFGAFRQMGSLPGVQRLLLLVFLYEFAFMVYPSVWAYFTAARFGWEARTIGLSLALFGISIAAVQGGLIRLILRRFGERGTVFWGLGFNTFAFLFLALVQNGTVALAFTPFIALGAVVTPALQGLMSQAVPDDAQGELQGVISSARAMAMILSPLAMTSVFAAFAGPGAPLHLPGAPFLVSMALMVVCGLVYVARPRAGAAA